VSSTRFEILFVTRLHALKMPPYGRLHLLRQHGDPILVPFAVTHHKLMRRKIDVFHPQTNAFRESHTGTVQQGGHDPCGTREVPEQRRHLVPRQHHRHTLGLFGTYHLVKPANVLLQDVLIEKQDGTQRRKGPGSIRDLFHTAHQVLLEGSHGRSPRRARP
jgi:hypothetical protein